MKLSVVLPCYNEAENLPHMLEILSSVLDTLPLQQEIIAIDDGSRDNTYNVLCDLQKKYAALKVVRFARNFGKEAAITCGLHLAKGDAVVLMDSDLQHPPEVIPQLVKKWQQGDEMVYALRQNRDGDSWKRRTGTKIFYWIFRRITDLSLPEGAGDFRLLDRKVVDAINQLGERNRFMKGLMTWVGFQTGVVHFDASIRSQGQSSFSFMGLMKFALDGFVAFSITPLRIWSLCGILISAGALVYLGYLVVMTWINGVDVPGFASLMCGILFMGGIQLIGLGVIGEYIGRIFNETKQRPLYIISRQHGDF